MQPGPRISLPSRRAGIPDEKNDCERTRKQWTAIRTAAANLSRHKRRTKRPTPNHPHLPGLVGLPPDPPRFIALAPIPEKHQQKRDAVFFKQGVPSPVLAPGAALGSRLRVALSSGQVIDHVIRNQRAGPAALRASVDPSQALSVRTMAAPPRESRTNEISAWGDVSRVEASPPRSLYAILGGQFLQSPAFYTAQPLPRLFPEAHEPAPSRDHRDTVLRDKLNIKKSGDALDTTNSFREVPPIKSQGRRTQELRKSPRGRFLRHFSRADCFPIMGGTFPVASFAVLRPGH